MSVIPVRVPANAKPVLATERRFTLTPDHPLYDVACPACDEALGGPYPVVLILAGIAPHNREGVSSWANGAGVAVHAVCASVPDVP